MTRLSEADRQNFFRYHITEEVLERAGIDRVAEGVRFPYRPLPNGDKNQPTWTYRTRRDGGAESKYVSEPDRHHLYFAPVDRQWAADGNAPVIFVEAEKSALMLLSFAEHHRLPMIPIALGGCWGFMGKRGIKLTESGERIADKGPLDELEVVRGRDVYLWFDKNVDTNAAVFAAQKNFLEALKAFGPKQRRVVKFPPGTPDHVNGPDDFACVLGLGELVKIIFQSSEPQDDVVAANLACQVPDMPEDCLAGALGELCLTRMAGFPRAYSYPALLASASALVEREPGDARTNLYAAQVGPVHSGKSQARAWAKDLLGASNSNTIDSLTGSGEQFSQLLNADGNARLFSPDELGHTLKKMQIDRSSLPFLFNRAFGEDDFTLTQSKHSAKKPELVRVFCHLSAVGGIVDADFEDYFGAATVAGFYDRVLFSLCPTGFIYHYFPFPRERRSVAYRVLRPPEIDREVWPALREWRSDPDLGRVVEICLRVATICAAYDGRKVLKPSELGPARKLVEYEKAVRTILRPNTGLTVEGRVTDVLMRFMRRLEPHVGITQRDLFSKTNIYRLSATTGVRVLNILVANGTLAETGGKRADQRLLYWPGTSLEEGERT